MKRFQYQLHFLRIFFKCEATRNQKGKGLRIQLRCTQFSLPLSFWAWHRTKREFFGKRIFLVIISALIIFTKILFSFLTSFFETLNSSCEPNQSWFNLSQMPVIFLLIASTLSRIRNNRWEWVYSGKNVTPVENTFWKFLIEKRAASVLFQSVAGNKCEIHCTLYGNFTRETWHFLELVDGISIFI